MTPGEVLTYFTLEYRYECDMYRVDLSHVCSICSYHSVAFVIEVKSVAA